jgi:uncharacterized protein YpiB (UPF0302 family)
MNQLLIVGFLIFSTMLHAQNQQPDAAKLNADAQKVVSIIGGDKAKTQTFCQMAILGKAIDDAIQEKDTKKLEELGQRISELEKQLAASWNLTRTSRSEVAHPR